MLNQSLSRKEMKQYPSKVWYTGTDAIDAGQGMCFVPTNVLTGGAATDFDPSRAVTVAKPSATNAQFFAGVAARSYAANAAGQPIDILLPGSVCEVSALIATTIGVTRLTCCAAGAPGRFIAAGHAGRGSCVSLRTQAAIAAITDLNDGIFGSNLVGTAVLAVSGTTYTLTSATSIFANVPITANLTGREYVFIAAGTTDATGAEQATPGRYKITAKTSDTVVILDPAGTAPAASSAGVACAVYAVRGNPQMLVKLDGSPVGGDESGLVEWVAPDSANVTTIAVMVGGFSFIFGGFTGLAVECAFTLANGTYPGLKKSFLLMATLTTGGFKVTVTRGVVHNTGGATATASYSVIASAILIIGNSEFHGVWSGSSWLIDTWNFTVASNPVIA